MFLKVFHKIIFCLNLLFLFSLIILLRYSYLILFSKILLNWIKFVYLCIICSSFSYQLLSLLHWSYLRGPVILAHKHIRFINIIHDSIFTCINILLLLIKLLLLISILVLNKFFSDSTNSSLFVNNISSLIYHLWLSIILFRGLCTG